MKKNFQILFLISFFLIFFSCKKEEEKIKSNREKIAGKWEVTSWLTAIGEMHGGILDSYQDSMLTQCGTYINSHFTDTLINETFEFDSEKGYLDFNTISKVTETNINLSYQNCSPIDTSYDYKYNNFYNIEIKDSNEVLITIIRPWEITWTGGSHDLIHDRLNYKVQTLTENALIILGSNNRPGLLFNPLNGVQGFERISFKRIN